MKNKILKTITFMATMGFIIAGCALDSESYLPAIVCAVCLAWLMLFVIANREVINETI